MSWESIPEPLAMEVAQLVKAGSIQGNKVIIIHSILKKVPHAHGLERVRRKTMFLLSILQQGLSSLVFYRCVVSLTHSTFVLQTAI